MVTSNTHTNLIVPPKEIAFLQAWVIVLFGEESSSNVMGNSWKGVQFLMLEGTHSEKMARGVGAVRRRSSSRQCRSTPYPLPFCHHQSIERERSNLKAPSKALKKGEWEDATCSVCMEYPHNAVLLLCSSHDKGCRPYMCGTSYRYSNCLDQFKKAYEGHEKCQVVELACPLCRGQVKGWTVVEPAREYLNAKRRSCMQDECAFHGTYRELRKHMRAAHPCAQPREVDPALEQKWKRLELERERRDVITTIRATTPGAYVMGDYVIEGNGGFDSDDDDDDDFEDDEGGFDASGDHDGIGNQNFLEVLLLWQAFRSEGNGGGGFNSRLRRLRQRSYEAFEAEGGHPPLMPTSAASASSEEDDLGVAEGRVGAGRAEQRRRRRRRSRQRSVIDFT